MQKLFKAGEIFLKMVIKIHVSGSSSPAQQA